MNDATRDGSTPRFVRPLPEYLVRHSDALSHPVGRWEVAFVKMYDGWRAYAQAHRYAYKSPIGDDYVLRVPWQAIGLSLLAMLNGETGRLDCGSMDKVIRQILAQEGCPADE
jgi:hypothetical protein